MQSGSIQLLPWFKNKPQNHQPFSSMVPTPTSDSIDVYRLTNPKLSEMSILSKNEYIFMDKLSKNIYINYIYIPYTFIFQLRTSYAALPSYAQLRFAQLRLVARSATVCTKVTRAWRTPRPRKVHQPF